MSRTFAALCLLAASSLNPSCVSHDVRSPAETRAEVVSELERYVAASRTVDPDRIAPFFTRDGVLFEPGIRPVETRAAIHAFLGSFPGARVEVATATPDAIDVGDGTALVWGTYFERLTFPGEPRSEQHGKFVMQWAREEGRWRIRRYYRVPLPPDPRIVPAMIR
jgi:uncharacterized protein (TIGR02246 family)